MTNSVIAHPLKIKYKLEIPSRKNTKKRDANTIADPASGWSIINIIGKSMKASAFICVLNWEISKLIWLKNLLKPSKVPIFANSEGCKLKFPIAYHDLAPPTSFPNRITPSNSNIVMPYIG